MKKVFYLLLTLSLSLGFVGCSNDDDDEDIASSVTPPPSVEEKDNRPDQGSIGKSSSIGNLSHRFKITSSDGWSTQWKTTEFKIEDYDTRILYAIGENYIYWNIRIPVGVGKASSHLVLRYWSDNPKSFDRKTYKDFFYNEMILSPSYVSFWSGLESSASLPHDKITISKIDSKNIKVEADYVLVEENYFTGAILITFDFELDKKD